MGKKPNPLAGVTDSTIAQVEDDLDEIVKQIMEKYSLTKMEALNIIGEYLKAASL